MSPRSCVHCGKSFTAAKNRKYCSDNCRKRFHDADLSKRRRCVDCGGPVGANSRPATRCHPCWAAREKARTAERGRQIERWWAEGLKVREIAERLGWTLGRTQQEMGRLRRKGFDLPRRGPGGRALDENWTLDS